MDYRKILSAGVAAIALMLGVTAADFTRSNTYTEGQFTDVPSSEWYASSVKDAYEFGIMNGDSAVTFNPNGTLTVAEGITITARLHATANGKTIPDASGEWYQKYVDYAIANGLMEDGQFDGYDINIKRFEIAELFAAVAGELPAVNSVSAIPDVASGVDYADAVLKLYGAGILGGNDEYGTFAPNSYLLRSEISAMAVRIADSTKRVQKALTPVNARAFTDSYYIIENPEATASGWDYDNRFDLLNYDGSRSAIISDSSDEQFFALNRDFDAEYEGILRLEVAGSFKSGDNGAYIALQNKDEERIVEITVKNGVWVLNGLNSVSSDVEVSKDISASYTFVLEIDLDKNTASVIINNRETAKVNIRPDAVLERLVLGTNKVGTGYIKKNHTRLSKNYVLDETFLVNSSVAGEKAAAWNMSGDFVLARMDSVLGDDIYSLKAESTAGSVSSASKSYEPVSGKVVMEAYVLFPEKTDGGAVSFTSGGNDVFKFEVKDSKIVMGDTVLHDYIPNVWQWLYVEADTLTGTATVKINGKKKADKTFDAKLFDGVSIGFAPTSDGVMWVDDLKVYPLIEHADYPAYPNVAQSSDYNIGINSCYLWRDTQSGEGWDAMSGYPEFDTPLGFYDEGLRETADWELKILAEHGIDFIHACWYSPSYRTYSQTAPIKKMRFSHSALHDGYMNAKYSDLVDFCIMWENSWGDVKSLDQFKAYIWPYWKEHYFSDDRYVRLDNKALITVWAHTTMMSSLGGSVAALKEAVDFMNEDIKSLGYDGIILLAQTQGANSASHYESLESMGFDGTYAYHYGTSGYSADYQISCNNTNAENSRDISHHIPTITNGFNNVGRGDTRHPVITGEDHLKVAESIKELLSTYNTGTWKDNTLIVATLNEYSEGTYAMPTEGTGWDYLENIRKVFTNNTSSDHSSADIELTETQLDRIGHMYPENRSRIRRLHLEKSEEESFVVTPDMLEPVRTYDMAKGGAENWNAEFGITGFSRENGVISGEGTGGDYAINSLAPKFKPIPASEAPYLHIRMKVSEKKDFEIFFMTNTALSWSGTRRVGASHEAAGEFVDYYIDMTVNPAWQDEIAGIRIDPLTAAGTFEISLIEFMNFIPAEDTAPKVSVNGTELSFAFNPELTSDGDYAVTAEPGKGLFSALRLYYEYHRAEDGNVLTIKTFDEHTYVLKLDSDKVTVDGVEKNLGYTLTLRDGLPVIHLKKLCDMLGYKYGINGNTLEIQSCSDEEYNKIMARAEDSWEFDFPGNIEDFVTLNGSIDVDGDGKMVFVPTGSDVGVFKLVNLKAENYTHITMGIEYSQVLTGQTPQLFFTTASDPTYGWTAKKCINGKYDLDGKKEGDIVEVRFRLSDNSDFAGTITGIRFDPIGTKDVFKLDYIRCIYDDSIDYEALTLFEQYNWEFEDSNTHNWLGQSSTLSVSGGTLNGVCTGADIGIVNPAVSFNCADAQMVIMGVKYNPDFCDGSADLFFVTDKSTQYSADKRIAANYILPEFVSEEDTVEIVFDLSTNSYFKSNIKGLRIDIHSGDYPFSVDYIRLYKKDGYIPPEENTVVNLITMPTSAVITDVENPPEGLKVAGGGAGKLEIVDDPENQGEKVYKIACVVPGNYYTYLYVHMNFEAGKKYNVSYKLYPLKTMNGDDYTTAIAGNVMYGSDGENVVNHILDAGETKSSGAGWIDVNTSLVIDSDCNPTEKDHFEIWGKPVDGTGVEYLVKDISIVPA